MPIENRIRQWFSKKRSQTCIKFDWCINNFVIGKTNSRQKIGGVLGLSEVETIIRKDNLKTQKVTKVAKVFHFKILT